MQPISREELFRKLEAGKVGALVDVLAPQYYRKFHLPGAINVPLDRQRFERDIRRAVPDKATPVVVYCMDADCPASAEAARRLDALGYRAVYDYAAGKQDWQEAGLPVER